MKFINFDNEDLLNKMLQMVFCEIILNENGKNIHKYSSFKGYLVYTKGNFRVTTTDLNESNQISIMPFCIKKDEILSIEIIKNT